MQRIFWMLIILVNVRNIFAVSNVFCGEYALKTEGTVLTTVHGKGKGVLIKAAAAFCYGAGVYALFLGAFLGLTAWFYGWEGLKVSAVFAGAESYTMIGAGHWTVGGLLPLAGQPEVPEASGKIEYNILTGKKNKSIW